MSTVKISELPVLSSVDAADEFVVVDDSAGVTKKITQAGLADFGSNALTAGTVTASGLVTASSGINFGSDTLDDYEEGTWTPTFNGTSTDAVGVYIKVGNVVHWWLHITTSSASGSTSAQWTLPFSVTQSGGGSNAARAVGGTSWQTYATRQVGALVENLPDNRLSFRDGAAQLTFDDVNGEQFFASGSFTTA